MEVPDRCAGSDGAEAETPAAVPGANASAAKGPIPPEERAARLVSYKKLYDWFRVGEYTFGQIRNNDRYSLEKRRTEDILFVEFNPETGLPRFPAQTPVAIP